MGTSVGSGALTMKRAIILAAIFEFCGAYFFGSHVTQTVQSGIINMEIFQGDPRLYVVGMLASLLSCGIWLQIASYFGLPVSTTHSIIGAVLGFGAVVGGVSGIDWAQVGSIVLSWIISPVSGACIAYIFFSLIRKYIFYKDNPLEAAKQWTPLYSFLVMAILSLSLLLSGADNFGLELSFPHVFSISFIAASIFAFFSNFFVMKIEAKNNDLHEQYAAIERIFSFLQTFTACLMAFAHGSNDVANAIGPLTGSVAVLLSGKMVIDSAVPNWALALGGVGIVIGLATWGWRVILTIGKKITELTPTRGFAAEFAAAFTVLLASRLGLPISATHTLIGAVLGVGFARGVEAINLTITRDILASWVITLPVGALLSVSFFYLLSPLFIS
jgi:phosphate/sulfate permease